MWTYLLRRLLMMIPTLFGVTIVSFCVMQMAPGDPLIAQMGSAGQSTQTRDSFLIQKRDLKLDKPLLLNTRYYTDHTAQVSAAAHFMGLSNEELVQELPALARAEETKDPVLVARLKFLQSLGIEEFQKRLSSPDDHARLAHAIEIYVQIDCEDLGEHGIPPAIELAANPEAPLKERIGAIRALNRFTTNPFVFTFSSVPKPDEGPAVQAAWKMWWDRQVDVPKVNPDRAKVLEKLIDNLTLNSDSSTLFDELDKFNSGDEPLGVEDLPFFIERALAPDQTHDPQKFAKQVISVTILKLLVSEPLRLDVPTSATVEEVAEVTANWKVWYDPRVAEFKPSRLAKAGLLLGDTQYAHMVWRLITFQFGKASLPPHEPVIEKIGNAFVVSAPLMLMAQFVIFVVAIPLGMLCAVYRERIVDHGIKVVVMMLYSIPPFVAGMLMLMYLCYGNYLKVFPVKGLLSDGAERFTTAQWLADYLWHATLPVACLSLFSLATMAMYSRSSLLDVLNMDYIRTARAKGLTEFTITLKHAVRNSLIPIITLFANFLPAMLGGSVLIEHLFNIQGMGHLSLQCILQKDISTLMAILYLDAIVVMFSMLLSDLLYVLADPRINLAATSEG